MPFDLNRVEIGYGCIHLTLTEYPQMLTDLGFNVSIHRESIGQVGGMHYIPVTVHLPAGVYAEKIPPNLEFKSRKYGMTLGMILYNGTIQMDIPIHKWV